MGGATRIARALFVASTIAASAWSTRARASETATPPSPPSHHFVYGQGIALLMNRVSVGYEFLPDAHHSFGVGVYGQLLGITHGGPNVAAGTVGGAGGELGYRYYFGGGGPSGPFVGVSALAGYFHSRADLYERDPNARWYMQYGGAVDLGWAVHLDRTIIAGFALGAQRTWLDEPGHLSDLADLLVGEGLRPRGQIQVGRVF
jgi:hypothetical protein